jgi:uncharacterized iron-regulated membrane protein
MKLRKLHRIVAIILAPFLLLLALTGSSLFFRKSGLYEKEIKEFLVSLHTWEIIAPYVGLFLGAGLLFLVVSGTILFFKKGA